MKRRDFITILASVTVCGDLPTYKYGTDSKDPIVRCRAAISADDCIRDGDRGRDCALIRGVRVRLAWRMTNPRWTNRGDGSI
jgi:hypothetical protein